MIYMDNSATTSVDEEVFKVMEPYFIKNFGNPSTLYSIGQEAKVALKNARSQVASLINANYDEIIFTSGGTESDNLAIKGVAFKNKDKGKHIISSEIEHPAVSESLNFLEGLGFEITLLPVYENGLVKVEDLKKAIRDDTILITIMHANNEIGTIQPIEEIGKIAKEKGIVFHCDAVQSIGKIEVDVNKLNVDLLSMSSHKIHGPKGVGAIYIRKGTILEPQIHGGHQERGIRSGTENMPGIVGFGKACEIAKENLKENYKYLKEITDSLIDKVSSSIEEVYLNGDANKRLPNIVNMRFTGIEGEALLLLLDAKGIQGSTGSACSSNTEGASPVLKALNLDDVYVHGSLRLSINTDITEDDIDYVVKSIKEAVEKLREISPLWK